jgi:hypothetical protein
MNEQEKEHYRQLIKEAKKALHEADSKNDEAMAQAMADPRNQEVLRKLAEAGD